MPSIDFVGWDDYNAARDTLENKDFVETGSGEWCHVDSAIIIRDEYYHEESTDYFLCAYCEDPQLEEDSDTISTEGGMFCCEDCAESGGYCWNEACGEWVLGDGLLPYDTSINKRDNVTAREPYLIGFEVEKEDSAFRSEAKELADEAGWIAVGDGSLCESTGFELVSPAYNLAGIDRIESKLEALRDILGADTTTACGGHITISEFGVAGEKLVERIGAGISLLYALYPKRLRSRWCEPKKRSEEKAGRGKYRAVNVLVDRVELRIFSRVRSAKQLLWRTRLIACLLDKREVCPRVTVFDKSSRLYKLLNEHYTHEEIEEKRALAIDFDTWRTTGEVSDKIAEYVPHRPDAVPASAPPATSFPVAPLPTTQFGGSSLPTGLADYYAREVTNLIRQGRRFADLRIISRAPGPIAIEYTRGEGDFVDALCMRGDGGAHTLGSRQTFAMRILLHAASFCPSFRNGATIGPPDSLGFCAVRHSNNEPAVHHYTVHIDTIIDRVENVLGAQYVGSEVRDRNDHPLTDRRS